MKIDIRNFILDNHRVIKNLMVSKSQLILIDAVINRYKYHGMKTSAFDVSIETCVSVQSASSRLKKLYDMGWLAREKKKDNSGGIYYVYFTEF